MKTHFQSFLHDQRGNVMIMAAIVLPVAAMVGGAAVTYSSASSSKSSYQKALDSAVLAAMSLPTSYSAGYREELAARFLTENRSRFTKSQAGSFESQFRATDESVQGTVKGQVKNPFAGLVGGEYIPVTVTAKAIRAKSNSLCVLALNGNETGAVDQNGQSEFTAVNCAIHANSLNSAAMRQVGKPHMKGAQIGVTGNFRGENYSPLPIPGSSVVKDPLAGVPFPSSGPCIDTKGKLQQSTVTLSPGTYCGGIRIMSQSKVTLEPGVYIMKDGPFWVQSNDTTVTGNDVMIAFTGKHSTLYVWGGSSLKLTSPSTGPYTNIQFFQDRNDSDLRGQWVSIIGDARVDFDGVMYFPTANVWVAGNSNVTGRSPNMIMIADKIWPQDQSKIVLHQHNMRNLSVAASPKFEYGARLAY